MKPSELSRELRHIAAAIENSQNPSRSLVSHDISNLVARMGSTSHTANEHFDVLPKGFDKDAQQRLKKLGIFEVEYEGKDFIEPTIYDKLEYGEILKLQESGKLKLKSNIPEEGLPGLTIKRTEIPEDPDWTAHRLQYGGWVLCSKPHPEKPGKFLQKEVKPKDIISVDKK